jgi:hypothetical protein
MKEIVPFLLYEDGQKFVLVGGAWLRPTYNKGFLKNLSLLYAWVVFCAAGITILMEYGEPSAFTTQEIVFFFAFVTAIYLGILIPMQVSNRAYTTRSTPSVLEKSRFVIDQEAKTVHFHSRSEDRLLGPLNELAIIITRYPWMNKGAGHRNIFAKVGDKRLLILSESRVSESPGEHALKEYLRAHNIKIENYVDRYFGGTKLE